jgi:hypothetical protein
MNNLYQRMLLKQHLEQEQYEKQAHKKHYEQYKHKEYYKNNYEKQKQRAREYYWKNREFILERRRTQKYNNQLYYKQWYEKNKVELNLRRGKRPRTKGVNFNYNNTYGITYNPMLDKKEPSFIVSFA